MINPFSFSIPNPLQSAVWEPDAGLDAFRSAVDPNGAYDTSAWHVEGDQLVIPADRGLFRQGLVLQPGYSLYMPNTLTVTVDR